MRTDADSVGTPANGSSSSLAASCKRVNSRAQSVGSWFHQRSGSCGLRIKRACKLGIRGRIATGQSREKDDGAASLWEAMDAAG